MMTWTMTRCTPYNLNPTSTTLGEALTVKYREIGGQAQKIENPANLPEEHFWGAIFENIS